MAYTTISELTRNSDTGSIENGKGFYFPMHTFFYAEDIKKVLNQAEGDADTKLSQLKMVSIKFEKNHGQRNHNQYDLTALALEKPVFDSNGNRTGTDWYEIVALPWPTYYKPDTVDGLVNTDNTSLYFGKLFKGYDQYIPGVEIHKEEEEELEE